MKKIIRKTLSLLTIWALLFTQYIPLAAAIGGTLYFNDSVVGAGTTGDWSDSANWWTDSAFTLPAGDVPDGSADVIIYASVTTGVASDIRTLTVQNGTIDIPITVSSGAAFWNASTNDSTLTVSGGVAEFHDSSINLSGVIGNAVFSDSSENQGLISGDAAFHDASSHIAGASVSGDATFNASAYVVSQIAGSVSGATIFPYMVTFTLSGLESWTHDSSTWIFNDIGIWDFQGTSSNSGTIPGNATFSDASTNGPLGIVMGDGNFYDTSVNHGSVELLMGIHDGRTFSSVNVGGAFYQVGFYDTSSNDISLTSSRETFFFGDSSNDGTITGDAYFYDTGTNTGTVLGVLVICNSRPLSVIGGTYTDVQLSDSAYNDVTVPGNAEFYDTAYNDGVISGNATFHDTTYNTLAGSVTGNAFFGCFSHNDGTVTGLITYESCPLYLSAGSDWNDPSAWWFDEAETIHINHIPGATDDVVLNSPVAINTGAPAVAHSLIVNAAADIGIDISVSSGATFNDASTNSATITGAVAFYGTSSNLGTVIGTTTFNDASTNAVNGIITGNAFFRDHTSNVDGLTPGLITGDATFDCFSENDGDVSGTTTYAACDAPNAPTMAPVTDTGSSSSDAITSDTTPTITGSCSNSRISVYLDTVLLDTVGNDGLVCSSSGGTYEIPILAPLVDGTYVINALQSNGKGFGFGDSLFSNDLTITIDTAAPTVTIYQPVGHSYGVSDTLVYTALFSEAIDPSTFDASDIVLTGSGVAIIDSIDEVPPFDGTTFDISMTATGAGTIVANIDANAFSDIAGNENILASTITDDSVVSSAGGGGGGVSYLAEEPSPIEEVKDIQPSMPLNAASDSELFLQLQKKHGASKITREIFEQQCLTDDGKPYFRSCENGYAFKTTYDFHQSMICEGFVTSQKTTYIDTMLRQDILAVTIKMRTKKELQQKQIRPFPENVYIDTANIGLAKRLNQALQFGLVSPQKSFRAEDLVTRSEAYAMIMKSVCMPTAGASKDWRENVYNIARGNAMTSKKTFESYHADAILNRGEMMVLASRAADWAEETGGCNPKPDMCFLVPLK